MYTQTVFSMTQLSTRLLLPNVTIHRECRRVVTCPELHCAAVVTVLVLPFVGEFNPITGEPYATQPVCVTQPLTDS